MKKCCVCCGKITFDNCSDDIIARYICELCIEKTPEIINHKKLEKDIIDSLEITDQIWQKLKEMMSSIGGIPKEYLEPATPSKEEIKVMAPFYSKLTLLVGLYMQKAEIRRKNQKQKGEDNDNGRR